MLSSSGSSKEDREETASLCPVIRELLPLMALRELRPGRARAVHLHLMKCKACRAKLAQYEAVTKLLRARWTGGVHDTVQPQSVVRPIHSPASSGGIHGRKGASLSSSAGASKSQASGATHARCGGGAIAFVRRRNEVFRAAFRDARPGRRYARPLPVSSEHMERMLLDSPLSDQPSHRLGPIATPSEAITIDVERCLARIAQQWCDPANQPPNEEFKPC
jgi:putative zinc finger protein